MLADASHTGGHQHSVSNFDDEDELRSTLVNVCSGSGADERGHRQEGLLLGAKRTKSTRKRTSVLEGPLLEEERTYRRRGPDFRF